MLCVSISVFVEKVIHRGHGSHDRLVRSSCILASSFSPPKPRRLRILNSHFAFFSRIQGNLPLRPTPAIRSEPADAVCSALLD